MNGGRLIAVVGPSGVGKDSVMTGIAAQNPTVQCARRTITRAPGLVGEDYEPTTQQVFEKLCAHGAFCLHWHAHGLSYGIPAHVLTDVEAGAYYLANLSRHVLLDASRVFPSLLVLNITAPPETLRKRLATRGRETTQDIAQRLSRAATPLPHGVDSFTISNDGPLGDTIARAVDLLHKQCTTQSKNNAIKRNFERSRI